MTGPAPVIWAVVIRVELDVDTSPEHRRAVLEEYVVPEYLELPGFLLASWLNDGVGNGLCIVEFDSEAHARAAVGPLTAVGGPAIVECGVYAVEWEASG